MGEYWLATFFIPKTDEDDRDDAAVIQIENGRQKEGRRKTLNYHALRRTETPERLIFGKMG